MAPRPVLESCSGDQTVLERPHDVVAHRDRRLAVQNSGSHDRVVLGENPWSKPGVTVLLGTSHNL